MNFFGLSPGELFLILVVAMIVLGPEKLPETAASIGKWIREFRRATQELTQQFADDNPFAELTRALQLDEPIVINGPTTTPLAEVPVAEVAAVATPAVTVETVVPAPTALAVRPRSDYFERPSLSAAVEDRWTHAGLADVAERAAQRQRPVILDPVADEWAHGVPFIVPLPVSAGESTTPGIYLATPEIAPYVYEPTIDAEESTNGVNHELNGVSLEPNGIGHEPEKVAAGAGHSSDDSTEDNPS